MKILLKTTLIVLAVALIVLAVVYFISGVDTPPQDYIPKTEFAKHIQSSVENRIRDVDYSEASIGFDAILGEIQTERSVMLNNGSKSISDEEYSECRKMTFFAFAPRFIRYAVEYYKTSEWDYSVLKKMERRAEELVEMKLAESSSPTEDTLKIIIQGVKDYETALNVIKEANYCTSIKRVEDIITLSDNYKKKWPLKNNYKLVSELGGVPSKAKDSYANFICNYCNKVAENFDKNVYESYAFFKEEYDKAASLIDSYIDKFGKRQNLQDAIELLYLKDQEAQKYYDSQQTPVP